MQVKLHGVPESHRGEGCLGEQSKRGSLTFNVVNPGQMTGRVFAAQMCTT